jgi:type III secretion system YscQ/HrcQ family protein
VNAERPPTILDPSAERGEDPLGGLPRLGSREAAIDRVVRRVLWAPGALAEGVAPGLPIALGGRETIWRASGLNRPGTVAHLAWPRLDARLGLGVETPLAHAIADHMLGFSRLPAEGHRQVTPVEWGILSFVFARSLDRLDAHPGPFGPWDLTIDRVSPDPFDPSDLGPMVTWRWPARLGGFSGSIRLWLPESILARLASTSPPPVEPGAAHAALTSTWRCEAGTITLPRGMSRLKAGVVLPIDGTTLRGTVAAPVGPLTLACQDRDGRSWFETSSVPNTSVSRLSIASPLRRELTPREPLAVSASPPQSTPADVPVTLVIELGRVNLTLSRLADLKPGDVVELGRHSREPVELTSNGKLIARGELVQIDTELGVRVTNVFL